MISHASRVLAGIWEKGMVAHTFIHRVLNEYLAEVRARRGVSNASCSSETKSLSALPKACRRRHHTVSVRVEPFRAQSTRGGGKWSGVR